MTRGPHSEWWRHNVCFPHGGGDQMVSLEKLWKWPGCSRRRQSISTGKERTVSASIYCLSPAFKHWAFSPTAVLYFKCAFWSRFPSFPLLSFSFFLCAHVYTNMCAGANMHVHVCMRVFMCMYMCVCERDKRPTLGAFLRCFPPYFGIRTLIMPRTHAD